ncbi:hypothetical protein [Mesorhizobium sp. YM1C-6-2]|uniref:hypothetical protein n=1 Tax=Mesorhizobium sp. YM1C-6-2 TaxID=1827501 RepID=UPI001FE17F5A|nr:hypothetical protein [Mesorhizobium sp. YM1C-6-2]
MDRHVRHRHGEPRPDGSQQRCLAPQRLLGLRTLGKLRYEPAADIDGNAVPAPAGNCEGLAGEGRMGGQDSRPEGIGYAVWNLKIDQ